MYQLQLIGLMKKSTDKVNYDTVNQRLSFVVDRTVLGTGTNSNFNSFTVFGSSLATSTNNLGVPSQNDASEVLIRGGEVLFTNTFVADGEEIQLNDKRYGINVNYNSDTKDFTFASGTTGEAIAANGALGLLKLKRHQILRLEGIYYQLLMGV